MPKIGHVVEKKHTPQGQILNGRLATIVIFIVSAVLLQRDKTNDIGRVTFQLFIPRVVYASKQLNLYNVSKNCITY